MNKIIKNTGNLFKYLVASVLVIIPLYSKFPFIEVPGTYVSIRFEDFLLAIVALLTVIKMATNFKSVFKENITRAMIIFIMVGFVSLFSGIFLTQTVIPSIGMLHLFRRIEYFIPFFAIMAFLPKGNDKNLEFYIKVLMVTVFIVFLYGLGQEYLGLPVIMTQNSESSKGIAMRWTPGSQITSTFAGHYDLALYMVLVLPVFISLIFVAKDKISKILLIIVSCSGYWLLVNSASRLSFVTYFIAVGVSLFLMNKKKAIPLVVIISLILGSFSPNLLARYKSLINVYFQKVKNIKMTQIIKPGFEVSAQEIVLPGGQNPSSPTPVPKPVIEDRSTSIRLNAEWPAALRAFRKNPLIGTGYSSIGLAADNDYLRLLAEVGILGLAGFLLIIIRIGLVFTSAFPLYKNMSGIKLGFIAGIIGGFSGTLVNALFIDVFEASKFATIFWLLIGLAVFTIKNQFYDHKN